MEKKLVICDTNIFIHFLNNDIKTIEILKIIGIENIAMSVVTAMELLQGMGNKKELEKMKKTIKQYNIIDFNDSVSKLTFEFIKSYSLSNKLQIPDAIIGATAVIYNLPLFTYNIKDFKFLPNIKLFQ